MCVGRVVSKTMQNGTFLCFRSAVFLHLLYYKYNSQWQGKTKRLRTGGGEWGLGDTGRQRAGAWNGFERPGRRASISLQWVYISQA